MYSLLQKQNELRFERFELAAEAERAALRAAAKERKDRKRDPTKAGSEAKPHRAADPQRAKKRGLRSILSAPEAAGLSMLPGSDHGHESDSLPETGAGSDHVPDSGSEGGARPGPTLPGHDDDMFSSFGDSDDDNYDRLKHTYKKPAAMPDFDDYPEHDADLEGIFDDSDIEDLPKPDEHTSEVLFIEEIPTEASNDILEEVINEDVEEELEEGHKLPKAFDFGLPDVQTVLGDVQIHSFGLEQSSSPRCV